MRANIRTASVVALGAIAAATSVTACSWSPGRLFDRDDPTVEEARASLRASQQSADADLSVARVNLEDFLRFRCDSEAGADLLVQRPGASLDLGLIVFRISELFGQRFGDEEVDAGESAERIATNRMRELGCAQLFLGKIANEPETPKGLALRARYLLGNIAFLARRYRDAVEYYDRVLVQHPARGLDPAEAGPPEDDDAVARDAAWNRAIALRRIEEDEKKDAGSDAPDSTPPDSPADSDDAQDTSDTGGGKDSSGDGSSDGSGDGGADGTNGGDSSSGDSANSGPDGGPSGGGDAAKRDEHDSRDQGAPDSGGPPPPSPSTRPPPMTSSRANLSELDRFERKAPLDLDLPARMKERRRIPPNLDK